VFFCENIWMAVVLVSITRANKAVVRYSGIVDAVLLGKFVKKHDDLMFSLGSCIV